MVGQASCLVENAGLLSFHPETAFFPFGYVSLHNYFVNVLIYASS